jgi:hypothetical protein
MPDVTRLLGKQVYVTPYCGFDKSAGLPIRQRARRARARMARVNPARWLEDELLNKD